MSTCCTIAIQDTIDKFRTIMCQNDGYPTGVGAYLLKYYHTWQRVEELFSLGDLNSIGANICDKDVSFLPGEEQSVCEVIEPFDGVARCKGHSNLDKYFDHGEFSCVMSDYIYLYRDDKWYVDVPYHHYGWKLLADVIESESKGKPVMTDRCNSRLYIVCKKTLNSEPIDIGHSMLSVGHSVAIAFNKWDKEYAFSRWRYDSFRKIVCQASEKEFESVKRKLTELNIDFQLCGEVHFGPDAEIALVVFPLEKDKTPKCLQYLQVWGK